MSVLDCNFAQLIISLMNDDGGHSLPGMPLIGRIDIESILSLPLSLSLSVSLNNGEMWDMIAIRTLCPALEQHTTREHRASSDGYLLDTDFMDERSMIDREGSTVRRGWWWWSNVHCDDRQGPSVVVVEDETRRRRLRWMFYQIARRLSGNRLWNWKLPPDRPLMWTNPQPIRRRWSCCCCVAKPIGGWLMEGKVYDKQRVYPHYLQDTEYDDRKLLLLCALYLTRPGDHLCCARGKGWTIERPVTILM